MTTAAAAPSKSYQLATTGYQPQQRVLVELPNGLTLIFYSKLKPLVVYIQQPGHSDPAVIDRLYEIIPCMPVDLLRLIVQYLPILTDLSHYPALTAGMQSLHPNSPEALVAESTTVMAMLPPSNEENSIQVKYTTQVFTEYALVFQPINQTKLIASEPTLEVDTCTLRRGSLMDAYINHLSSPALQQHPLGGEIDYLITPLKNGNPETEKNHLVHLSIVQSADDEDPQALMNKQAAKHAKASATMAELHEKQQTATVEEVD